MKKQNLYFAIKKNHFSLKQYSLHKKYFLLEQIKICSSLRIFKINFCNLNNIDKRNLKFVFFFNFAIMILLTEIILFRLSKIKNCELYK